MKKEEWRTIERLDNKYAVSNFKRLKNLKTGNVLKPTGASIYSIVHKGKQYGINSYREFNDLFPELPQMKLRAKRVFGKNKSVKRFKKTVIEINKDNIVEKSKDNYIDIDRIKMLIKDVITTKTKTNSIVTIALDKDPHTTVKLRLGIDDTKIINTALYELFKSRNKSKITIKHLYSPNVTKIYYDS